MKKNRYIDTLYLAIGELIVSAIVSLGALAIGFFDFTIVSGALLGSIVTVINFFILSVAVNRAVDKYIEIRGDKEMTEEEADEFTKKHKMDIQNAMTKSYVLRNAFMIGALVIGLLTKLFNPIATLIPLVMYKPLIYITEILKRKRGE